MRNNTLGVYFRHIAIIKIAFVATVATLSIIISILKSNAMQITEVMYDPSGTDTGHEWVELYNDGAGSATLTGYKFYEANVNHGISAIRGGSSMDAGEYVVLADDAAKFIADYPSYTGKVFDSSFSLSNSGEALALKDASLTVVSSISYNTSLGAAGDGNTLCEVLSVWAVCIATPGAANILYNTPSNSTSTSSDTNTNSTTTTNNATTSTGSNSNTSTSNNYFSIPDSTNYRYGNLDIKALRERSVIAGGEYVYSAKAFNYKGEPVTKVNYFYSFGDGGGRESTGDAKYTYGYPGEYDLNIEGDTSEGEGMAVMKVYVSRPDISIIEIGQSEPYIKLHNGSGRDLDLSNYIIDNQNGYFKIAKNTKIRAGSDLSLSGYAMGFATSSSARLLFPNMKEVTGFTFAKPQSPVAILNNSQAVTLIHNNNSNANINNITSANNNSVSTTSYILNSASNTYSALKIKSDIKNINVQDQNKNNAKLSPAGNANNFNQVKYVYKNNSNLAKANIDIASLTKSNNGNTDNNVTNISGPQNVISDASEPPLNQSGEKTLVERLKLWLYK